MNTPTSGLHVPPDARPGRRGPPDGVTRDQLANDLEMAAAGGTFGTYLSTLRRNGLVEIRGSTVYAAGALFMGATA